MPHKCFYGKQVRAVLIQVGAESMAEGVAGKPAPPSKSVLMGMDVPREEEGVDGPVLPVLFREKEALGPATFIPVAGEQVQCGMRKDGVTVIPAFGAGDVKPHIPAVNIFIAEAADLADAEAGGVHEGDHGSLF